MNEESEAFAELKRGVRAALETYGNVHRGSGHNSTVTTQLYEQARGIVLAYLGLNADKYTVIFGTPRRAEALKARLKPGSYHIVSSEDIGLPLGLRALAVERKALPRGIPFQTGGGTARLVSPGWVIWAKAPDRFEAGTPAIVNVIALALALQLTRRALRGLAQIPGLTLYGIKDPDSQRFARKGGVVVFDVKGIMAPRVAKELAERGGIGVRSGCHCAHLLVKHLIDIPPLLAQFQGLMLTLFPRLSLPGLTRMSLGLENSEEDVDTLIHVLGNIARQPRAGMDTPFASTQTDVQKQMDDCARAASQTVYTQFEGTQVL